MASVIRAEHGDDAGVADHVAAAVRNGGRSLAISGGKTVTSILEILAARDLPWAGVHIVPTDDRCVPHDHGASNFGALRRAFAPTPVCVEPLSPGMTVAPFDLVWLGMGTDGHIASLFPGTPLRVGDVPGVVEVRPEPLPPEAPFDRLSLNLDALTATRDLILVIRGAEKLAVLETAIQGRCNLPIAGLIAAATQPIRLFWSET